MNNVLFDSLLSTLIVNFNVLSLLIVFRIDREVDQLNYHKRVRENEFLFQRVYIVKLGARLLHEWYM